MIVRLILVIVLALVVAASAGHFLAADPGFVVIGYGGKVLRLSFALFLLLNLLSVALLYAGVALIARLFGLRRRWRGWSQERRRRRAYRSLTAGMLARGAGDFVRAERLFAYGAHTDTGAAAHYLAAAEAAHAARARGRRDNYLRLAHQAEAQAGPTLDLQRAGWLLEAGELDAAAALIGSLAERQPSTPPLLRLRQRLLELRHDHHGLLCLVPELRRDRALSHDAANLLERDCAVAVLTDATTAPEVLQTRWEGLSKPLRATTTVVMAYVRGLIRAGRHDTAEALVARQLERRWDSELAALYGDIVCEPASRQLRKVDAWAGSRDDDRGLRLARARLAMRAQLWGPARTQLELLLADGPAPLFYRLLAEIADHTGEAEAARRYRRLGLELATASASGALT